MAVPPSADLPRVLNSVDFNNLVERVKRELQVSIVPNIKTPNTSNGNSGTETPTEISFKFRCQRSNSDFLITAREMFEQFLLNHNIHVYPSPTAQIHKRGDSFAEAFPHFDSKVLSTAKTRGHGLSCLTGFEFYISLSFRICGYGSTRYGRSPPPTGEFFTGCQGSLQFAILYLQSRGATRRSRVELLASRSGH